MNLRYAWLVVAGSLAAGMAGCTSVRAPERIEVSVGGGSGHVDSSRVPKPKTLEEARAELGKAYAQIQRLERKIGDLEEDEAKCEREREMYKEQRDEYKDRLEECEDD